MPVNETIAILENKKVNEEYFKLVFRSAALSKNVQPGQFFNLQIQAGLDPFLPRPFSYYRVSGDHIEILYEVLGRGTAILAHKKKGETLRAVGPLGKPFTGARPHKGRGQAPLKKRVLIAGGVGVPPLVFLAERFPMDYLLIGTKSRKEVLPKTELKKVKAEILYSTNDGSYGQKGYVTVLLEDILKQESPKNLFIQTCGPNVMMEAVIKIAGREGIEGEASVDKPMACGVGACLGCMVKTKEGWTPSCVEGPVFRFEDLDLSHGL